MARNQTHSEPNHKWNTTSTTPTPWPEGKITPHTLVISTVPTAQVLSWLLREQVLTFSVPTTVAGKLTANM